MNFLNKCIHLIGYVLTNVLWKKAFGRKATEKRFGKTKVVFIKRSNHRLQFIIFSLSLVKIGLKRNSVTHAEGEKLKLNRLHQIVAHHTNRTNRCGSKRSKMKIAKGSIISCMFTKAIIGTRKSDRSGHNARTFSNNIRPMLLMTLTCM